MIDGETQPGIQLVPKENNGPLYQSPILPDATHNLTITTNVSDDSQSGIIGFIDYATITAGENTPFQGQSLIVDDTDPSIKFEGDWTRNTSFQVFKIVMMFHGNGGDHGHTRLLEAFLLLQHMETPLIKPLHVVQQPRFVLMVGILEEIYDALIPPCITGTSVSVFGIKSFENTSWLDMTYTMDGGIPLDVQSTPAGQLGNVQWFHKEDLAATNHTLIMQVSSFGNTSFNLDYILYTPSFTSLAEEKGLSILQSSSSQSQATSTATGPQISTTPVTAQPAANGTFHEKLLAAIVVPALIGVITIILLIMRRKKLLFWSSRQSSTAGMIVEPGFSQLRVYHKSSTVNSQNVENPIPDHDLPLIGTTATSDGILPATHQRARWWARLWRRRQPGTLEAFPSNWNPSSSNRPMIQWKPLLPAWASRAGQQRESHQSDTNTANETIIVDPRVQELEELVFSLQQEIEETRQDRSGAQNGALMRELVENHTELPNEHSQESWDHASVTMSATVV
ncbi:hypothetical protein C0995_008107 [Termitomyces sp. Mi166|nr:hypothetical protein C0995_008107 [Termitomyces sp. Mi166\